MYYQIPNKKGDFNPEIHKINIERRILERDGLFNTDTRIKQYNNTNYTNINKSNIGEITGQSLDMNEYLDQGMPTRFFMSTLNSIEKIDNNDPNKIYETFNNPKLDFNLYDSKPNSSISYFDPVQLNTIQPSFSDINRTTELLPPIETLSPEKRFSNYINKFAIDIFNDFRHNLKNNQPLLIGPYSLLSNIIALYRASKGNTEKEIQNILSLPNKNVSFDCMNKIIQNLNHYTDLLMYNISIFPKDKPLNRAYINYISNMSIVDTIDMNNISKEIARLNNNALYKTKGIVKNILKQKIINQNTSIIQINAIIFSSEWKYNFELVKYRTFYGDNQRDINMMIQQKKIYKYFEDNINKIIEIDFKSEKLSMGIIMSKTNSELAINHEQIEYYISKLTDTLISYIEIPKFTQQSRYRVDSIFKKQGIRDLFINANLDDITPSNDIVYLSDIIHQTYFAINENGKIHNKINKHGENIKRGINFIANHPFIYYLRYVPDNIILMIGQFY